MTVYHASLTGTQNHEPLDVSSATNNQLRFADGDGSGDWKVLFQKSEWNYSTPVSAVEFTSISDFNEIVIWYHDVIQSSSTGLYLQLGDNISDYRTTSGDYKWSREGQTDGSDASVADTGFMIADGKYHTGYIKLVNFNKIGLTLINGLTHVANTSFGAGGAETRAVNGKMTTADNYDKLRFNFENAGNFSGGRIVVIGMTSGNDDYFLNNSLLLSGDMADVVTDKVLLSGDMQSSTDAMDLSGDEAL